VESLFKTLKGEEDKLEGRHTKEEVRVEVCEYRELIIISAVDIRRSAMLYR
jgi:hypothetical protein